MRLSPTAWLEHLDAAHTLALAGDAEGVHQVRVSLRRLRVWLSFTKGARALDRELRWACRALAELRDLDVFGEVFTAEARAALRPDIVTKATDALQSARWEALRAALDEARPPRRRRARKVRRRLEAAVERRREAVTPGDGEALHALRRELRRLRYAREWLGEDAADLALDQERLGAVCDLLALARFAKGHGAAVPTTLAEGIARAYELAG